MSAATDPETPSPQQGAKAQVPDRLPDAGAAPPTGLHSTTQTVTQQQGGEQGAGPAPPMHAMSASHLLAPHGQAKLVAVFRAHGYTMLEQIGKGTYGTVYKTRKDQTGEEFAIKVLDLQVLSLRSGFDDARLMREANVMQKLNHPNLCRLFETIRTSDYFLLVLELIRGQDLFDTILARKGISDMDARYLFRQIFSAIGYMHAKGIVHRDLKPENILLDGIPLENRDKGIIDENTQVKIVDFGLSKEQAINNTFAGTPRYIAPEVLAVGEAEKRRRAGMADHVTSTYGTQVDCYSAGIVLFVSLAGSFPRFERDAEGFECVKFAPDTKVTPKARALIHGLTHPDPTRRLTIQQALVDPWLLDPAATLLNLSVPSIGAALLMQPLPQFEWHARRSSSSSSVSSSLNGTMGIKTDSDIVTRFDCEKLNQLKEQIEACFAPGAKQSPELLVHAGTVRVLMSESMRALMMLTNTADSVVGLITDTQFACEEGEPDLVSSTLLNAKTWIAKFIVEARSLKDRSDQVVHDIESVVSDAGPGSLLSRLQAHRQFIINLDVTANFLVQRTEHLEGLTSMVRNPKMRPRFVERLQEYLSDWQRLLQCLHGPLFVHLKMNELLAVKQPSIKQGPEPDEGTPLGVYRNGMIRLM